MAAEHGFPKSRHLLKTDEISSVFSFKCRFSGEYLQLLVKPNPLHHPRLAMIVAKKTAPRAVDRNYIKRVVREVFRLEQATLGGMDCVVRANKRFGRTDFDGVQAELRRLFAKAARRNRQAGSA